MQLTSAWCDRIPDGTHRVQSMQSITKLTALQTSTPPMELLAGGLVPTAARRLSDQSTVPRIVTRSTGRLATEEGRCSNFLYFETGSPQQHFNAGLTEWRGLAIRWAEKKEQGRWLKLDKYHHKTSEDHGGTLKEEKRRSQVAESHTTAMISRVTW